MHRGAGGGTCAILCGKHDPLSMKSHFNCEQHRKSFCCQLNLSVGFGIRRDREREGERGRARKRKRREERKQTALRAQRGQEERRRCTRKKRNEDRAE
ncbi:hypothetical protein MATL_G00127250 [Megalops atlanticus]|uniref:Uncharacterized protein n=1 Tax=Megalops atlanticus TaxID=7932 RepID=A0A9D3PZI9_MEGAT|nr:hypothetical protein MATL_G00127250 [Megalops atlanticus]